MKSISVTGGARIGLMNATWPFATLNATNDSLALNASILGKYSFTPEQIVNIEKITHLPFLGWGIRIHHCIPDYPEKIIFWCLGSPQKLLNQLEDIGFIPKGKSENLPSRSFPVRWQAIVGIILLWNLLFSFDLFFSDSSSAQPDLFSFLAVFLLFLGCTTIWKAKFIQSIILKPGRNPYEIRHWLYLLSFISGVMSIAMFFTVITGTVNDNQEITDELINQNRNLFCQPSPPQLEEFSRIDSQYNGFSILLSTSFEPNPETQLVDISPFIQNTKAKISRIDSCSSSGRYSLSVIPVRSKIYGKLVPFSFDYIKTGTTLSSSFYQYEPFEVSNFKAVKLNFMRYSTSNPDKKEDFNCATSLNIYYRLNGGEWTHKMAFCGQHITETTGWRKSELIFETKGQSTIEFLFSYESFKPDKSSVHYLIDDLIISGIK